MAEAILLTGAPRSGKTTLLRRIVCRMGGAAGGFYTEEIRERGVRTGFELVTLAGREAVFAHVNIRSPLRLGKYGLELNALEEVGLKAIQQARREGKLVVLDEIGPMEIKSAAFREAVLELFDSGAPVLGTIVKRSLPFTDAIKSRPKVEVVEVTPQNRETLLEALLQQVNAMPGAWHE